jgi:hypothetical protein
MFSHLAEFLKGKTQDQKWGLEIATIPGRIGETVSGEGSEVRNNCV